MESLAKGDQLRRLLLDFVAIRVLDQGQTGIAMHHCRTAATA